MATFSMLPYTLSLNFFPDIRNAILEIHKVLVNGSTLICAVPVPVRNQLGSKIRGTLYAEEELNTLFHESDFVRHSLTYGWVFWCAVG